MIAWFTGLHAFAVVLGVGLAAAAACGRIELDESYHTREGAMGMRQVQGGAIDVLPGQAVQLQADGLHLMCMDKKQELASGSRVPLTLRFQTAGDVPISVAVRER